MSLTSTTSSADPAVQLQVIEIKPGVRFGLGMLRDSLPDVETALFFGKVYDLDAQQLANLLLHVLNTPLAAALFGEGGSHSTELQGYLLDGYRVCRTCGVSEDEHYEDECSYTDFEWHEPIIGAAEAGQVNLSPDVPHGEILPQVWEALEIEVAQSIKDVAAKLEGVLSMMPSKQGQMVFRSLAVLNKKRPTIGDYQAGVHHGRMPDNNLVILDVSGSMSASTVEKIADDVVALSYNVNAHFAIVSNTTTYWQPGTYSTADILAAAQYGGTHYETLAPLFDRDWGTVITIADYDSSEAAKKKLAPSRKIKGSIEEVLDISLVNRPTFLAECVGQLATKVRPILIANSQYVLA